MNYKHGLTKSRIHNTWNHMKDRCYNSKSQNYARYGNRGITICEEWRNDFMSFYEWAMANGYQDNLTIDRIDNDGNYEPSNCRWITLKEQNFNYSKNRLITHRGKTQTLTEWANEIGISTATLFARLKTDGVSKST